ncbi:MAG: DUF1559 domain-containing protein [Planctomycetes bacterium]|nr:DUF1559 domain-containing protein [Planctomycetota bacterium]
MRRGITALEVLIVLVICIVGAGLVVMLIARTREKAQNVQCRNNLRQIGKAFHAYHDNSSADENLRVLPPSRIAEGYATWAVLLAPHLTKESPLLQWEQQRSYFAQQQDVREARLIAYFCPTRLRSDTLSQAGDADHGHFPGGVGDYASVAGDGSAGHDWTGPYANGPLVFATVVDRQDERILKWRSRTGLASLKRGTQQTLLVGEKHVPVGHHGDAAFGDGSLYNGANPASFARIAGPGYPLAPAIDAPFNNNFGSCHRGICHFLMADASFKAFANDVDPAVLGKLARRGD